MFGKSNITGKDVRNVSNNKHIQLCYDERIVIKNRLKNGESYTAIAKSLGRSTGTISP
ncbi:helix-turn-helix domain-containing protein [TM7 phylum sp. oral taxon 349]|nr:helix-turn-helix domain-containing protein [TM7 phylum sp. oral taxon 349]